jgi:hypothetical protein
MSCDDISMSSVPVQARQLRCPDSCAQLLQLLLPVHHTVEAQEARIQLIN